MLLCLIIAYSHKKDLKIVFSTEIDIFMKDKNKIIEQINDGNNLIKLDVGCGEKKKSNEYIGIDLIDSDKVDLAGNYYDVFQQINSEAVDEIFSSHFLEHIENIGEFLYESARILKRDGKLIISVPHFSNPYFYSDPTHLRYFGLYTFSYFADCNFLKRKVPQYKNKIKYKIHRIDLSFSSTRPFYFRHAIKKIWGLIFNSSYYMQEFWEENLCYLIPAYEITFELKKID